MLDKIMQFFSSPRRLTLCVIGICIAIIGAFVIANPAPPKTITIATGAEGGVYRVFGEEYREFFAKRGIDLKLLPTKGAQENADLILEPDSPVDIAFIQSGLLVPKNAKHLETLGSIAYEPIWLFYRSHMANDSVQKLIDLSNRKLSVGEKGSGTYTEAMHLLSLTGLHQDAHLVNLPTAEGVSAIRKGEIDALFLIQNIDSPNVQALIEDPNLRLANFIRADAYVKRMPYLEALTVPMGSLDLKRNFPDQNTRLIATTTELVIKKELHPAIQMLFLQAAREINGKESFFSKRGEFPSFRTSGLTESAQAILYYDKGLPFLMNYLPFTLAEIIHRMIFLILPLLAIAFPVIQYVPQLWDKYMRNRINRMYGCLKSLENDITNSHDPDLYPEFRARLDKISQEALVLRHSQDHHLEYYTLRGHIDYVRECLKAGIYAQRHEN
jgi:TRAP-type uncharacterized transport system substrate-binding protein